MSATNERCSLTQFVHAKEHPDQKQTHCSVQQKALGANVLRSLRCGGGSQRLGHGRTEGLVVPPHCACRAFLALADASASAVAFDSDSAAVVGAKEAVARGRCKAARTFCTPRRSLAAWSIKGAQTRQETRLGDVRRVAPSPRVVVVRENGTGGVADYAVRARPSASQSARSERRLQWRAQTAAAIASVFAQVFTRVGTGPKKVTLRTEVKERRRDGQFFVHLVAADVALFVQRSDVASRSRGAAVCAAAPPALGISCAKQAVEFAAACIVVVGRALRLVPLACCCHGQHDAQQRHHLCKPGLALRSHGPFQVAKKLCSDERQLFCSLAMLTLTLALLLAMVDADVYMQNPRGS